MGSHSSPHLGQDDGCRNIQRPLCILPLDGSAYPSFSKGPAPEESWALPRAQCTHSTALSFPVISCAGESKGAPLQPGCKAGGCRLPAGRSKGIYRRCNTPVPSALEVKSSLASKLRVPESRAPAPPHCAQVVPRKVLSRKQVQKRPAHTHQVRGRLPHPSHLHSPGSHRTPRCPSRRPHCCSGSN